MPSASTQPDADWADALTTLLGEQDALVARLAELAEAQGGHVAEGRTDELMGVLAERQSLVDRLAALQDEFRRLADGLPDRLETLPEAPRARIRAMVDGIGARLADVLARDEADRAALAARRDVARRDLDGLGAGRQAARAYAPAGRQGSRYADRRG